MNVWREQHNWQQWSSWWLSFLGLLGRTFSVSWQHILAVVPHRAPLYVSQGTFSFCVSPDCCRAPPRCSFSLPCRSMPLLSSEFRALATVSYRDVSVLDFWTSSHPRSTQSDLLICRLSRQVCPPPLCCFRSGCIEDRNNPGWVKK